MTDKDTDPERRTASADLRTRLDEAEGALRASRDGGADALAVAGRQSDELYLPGESDRIYRQFIEAAAEGTATLSAGGVILSCNVNFARTLQRPLDQLLGSSLRDHLPPADREILSSILAEADPASRRREIRLRTAEGSLVPVYLSATLLRRARAQPVVCAVFTELKLVVSAEEALRGCETRYRALFENNPDAVLLTTPDGGILSANPAACRMFGRTEGELRALGRGAVVEPSDSRLQGLLEERARTGRASGELTCIRKDGSSFPAEVSSLLFSDQSGAARTTTVIRDITERGQAEAALRDSEARYRSLFERNPQPMWVYDLETLVFLAVNNGAIAHYGYSRDEFLSMTIRDIRPPEEVPKLLASLSRERCGIKQSGVWVHRKKDGSTILVEITSHALDFNGRPAALVHAHDITVRKRAEAERERLTVAIEAAGETVLVTDAKGTIQYVNPVFETVTGYSRAEVLGKNSRILRSAEHQETLHREAMETINSGRVWRGRLVNSRKDGSLYTVESTISPMRDEAGRIVNHVGVERDITEQLRLVEERARLEDRLRQAQKIEAIGRLAAGVAHDFNNLTAIVLGYGEMLLGQIRPGEPGHGWAKQIVEAGRRSAALTRQLLAFSRKQVLQPEVLDLNALLLNLEKMLGRLIGEDIRLELRLAADLGRITADPGQIEQVVTNIVLNARDAMPRGGKLTVETANVELGEAFARDHESFIPGKYVVLALSDIGCGMDAATLARLFEPFFTTKEMGKGTGLGLATAFGIVKQSGGYLYAESEPGKGTTFKVYLPWTDAAPTAKEVQTSSEVPRGRGERILLVEDEASLRELCDDVLSGLGYRVAAAGSGPEALLLLEEQGFEPDLVLTDVVMPGMSGAEMVDRLRGSRPGIKALYMSGYTDEATARHGMLDQGTHFLQKPFSGSALAEKVRLSLGGEAAVTRRVGRVLMIDDDEQFRDLVRHFCAKRGYGFTGAGGSAAAIAALAGEPVDVLLVDMNIPGTSGERILREIRAAGHTAPAIALTGDLASADMDLLRPLGVVRALEKSGNTEPLLQAIGAAATGGGI